MPGLRKYGHPPYAVFVVHGGPGALGSLAPVARQLSSCHGVLEPLLEEKSIDGQARGLEAAIERHGYPPVTVIGHSWGAWLSFILAARRPDLVRKLILVGSGPFQDRYARHLDEARLGRLSEGDRRRAGLLTKALAAGDDAAFAELGELLARADAYDPLPSDESLPPRADVFRAVWPEASELRRSGALLALAKEIRCPVVAIHGDCDPHPYEGVKGPLEKALKDFRFILLEKCGHEPWRERQARDGFFALLEKEIEP